MAYEDEEQLAAEYDELLKVKVKDTIPFHIRIEFHYPVFRKHSPQKDCYRS